MAVHEQSDGLIPNKQTPPATSQIGTSADKWDEINATAVNVNGFSAAKVYSETVDLVALTGYTVTHGLNNSNPLIMVYGSGTNEVLPIGSGAGTVITAASGSTANAVVITATAGAPGSTVVVIG